MNAKTLGVQQRFFTTKSDNFIRYISHSPNYTTKEILNVNKAVKFHHSKRIISSSDFAGMFSNV